MTTRYLSANGCPVVSVEVVDSTTSIHAMLMVDTGATFTSLNHKLLKQIGVKTSKNKSIIVSAAGVFETTSATIKKVRLGDIAQSNLTVVALDLPTASEIDGVLGVDFFKNRKLTIDFKKHTIEVKA